MNIKRVIIAFLILVLLVAGLLYFFKKNNKTSISYIPEETSTVETQIKEKIKGVTIPDDENTIELVNVSGREGMGILTKTGVYADLPELEIGESYKVFVANGSSKIMIGYLTSAKGGYILEFDLSKYREYKQLIIMKGDETILTGSF